MPAFAVRALAAAILTAPLIAQTQLPTDLKRTVQELQESIVTGDVIQAADLAAKLDDAIQRQFRANLNRDAIQRVADVLAWLPADTESLMVLQEPTVLDPKDSPRANDERPAQFYALERLMALNDGQIFRQLSGRRVRLMVAGMRDIRSRAMGAGPWAMPDSEVAYFYFFSELFFRPRHLLGRLCCRLLTGATRIRD